MGQHITTFLTLTLAADVVLERAQALEVFDHVSTCVECAEELAKHKDLVTRLIEAHQAALSELPAEEQFVLDDDLGELVTFARAITPKLPATIRRELEVPLRDDERLEPFVRFSLEPVLERVADAVSEVSLVLLSLISKHKNLSVVADTDAAGSLVYGDGGHIPAKYVASRIVSQTSLSPEAAMAIWKALVDIADTAGFPHIHTEVERPLPDPHPRPGVPRCRLSLTQATLPPPASN